MTQFNINSNERSDELKTLFEMSIKTDNQWLLNAIKNSILKYDDIGDPDQHYSPWIFPKVKLGADELPF